MKRIFIVGYMGSGKTTEGKRLSEKYGLQFVDLDQYIENQCQKTIPQLFEENGESAFRKMEQKMLKEVTAALEEAIISTGGGTACFFDNMDFMNENGETVYLKASPDDLADYLITAKGSRPLLTNKSNAEIRAYVKDAFTRREPFYLKAKHVVEAKDVSDKLFDKLLL